MENITLSIKYIKIAGIVLAITLIGYFGYQTIAYFQENGNLTKENAQLKNVLTTGANCPTLILNALNSTKSEQNPLGLLSVPETVFNGATGTLILQPINFIPNK